MMDLVLQETTVQVKYWSHASLTKKQVKEVLFITAQQQSRQKDFYRDLMLKLDRSLTQVVSVKNYEIRNSKSDYMHILEYLCRVSFLTTLDIYKDYFKGCHTGCNIVAIFVFSHTMHVISLCITLHQMWQPLK